MDVFRKSDIRRIDVVIETVDENLEHVGTKNVAYMFNANVISEDEAQDVIKSGQADGHAKIIAATQMQADLFATKTKNASLADVIRDLNDEQLAIFTKTLASGNCDVWAAAFIAKSFEPDKSKAKSGATDIKPDKTLLKKPRDEF